MRICFITKFPPIQGGVSTQCYWTARGLAKAGHHVFVVTNADEVEDTFRISILSAEFAARQALSDVPGKGSLSVHSTEAPDQSRIYYVPIGTAIITRMVSLAVEVIRRNRCDVIFSYYFEPYGVVAKIASDITGVPFVVKHAGSDLFRLFEQPELQTFYASMLESAAAVVGVGRGVERLRNAKVPASKIATDISYALPTTEFKPTRSDVTLEDALGKLAIDDDALSRIRVDVPTLLSYGKLGEFKGTYDLLHAFRRLIDGGRDAQLLLVANGWQSERVRTLITSLDVSERVHMLPFQANWLLPDLIRASTAVAFLERDFPIKAHMPSIPLEVLSCGGCLITTSEVARKQIFRHDLRNGRNIVVCNDPKDRASLTHSLEFVVGDPARARAVGDMGARQLALPTLRGRFDIYLRALARLLRSVRSKHVRGNGAVKNMSAHASWPSKKTDYPITCALLENLVDDRVRAAIASTAEFRKASPLRQIGRMAEATGELQAFCRGLLTFEKLMNKWERNGDEDARQSSDISGLQPDSAISLSVNCEIVEFNHDYGYCLDDKKRPSVNAKKNKCLYLFSEHGRPIRINKASSVLIQRLGTRGRLTIRQLTADLFGEASEAADLERMSDIVEAFAWEGLIRVDGPSLKSNKGETCHAS